MTNILIFFIFLILIVFVIQYVPRFFYDYKITESDVRIVHFNRIPVMRIDFRDIVEIRKITFVEAVKLNQFSTLRYGNRIWGDIVLIKKSKGLFRNVVISPNDGEKFVNNVNKHR